MDYRNRTTLPIVPKRVGQSVAPYELHKWAEAWLAKAPTGDEHGPTRADYVFYATQGGVILSPMERNYLTEQANRMGAVDGEREYDAIRILSDGVVVNTRHRDPSDAPGTTPALNTLSGYTAAERTEDQVRRANNPTAPYWPGDERTYGPYRVLGQYTEHHVTLGGLRTRSSGHYPGKQNGRAQRVVAGQASAAKRREQAGNKDAKDAKRKANERRRARLKAEREARAAERELARKLARQDALAGADT